MIIILPQIISDGYTGAAIAEIAAFDLYPKMIHNIGSESLMAIQDNRVARSMVSPQWMAERKTEVLYRLQVNLTRGLPALWSELRTVWRAANAAMDKHMLEFSGITDYVYRCYADIDNVVLILRGRMRTEMLALPLCTLGGYMYTIVNDVEYGKRVAKSVKESANR